MNFISVAVFYLIEYCSASSYVTCHPDWKNAGFHLNKSSSKTNFISVAVFYLIEYCSGSILNSPFIIAVLKTKSLWTIPNILLLSLSINDLIMSLTIIPGKMYDAVLLSKGRLRCNLYIWLTRSMFCSLCINLSLIILIQNVLCIFLKPGLSISCKDRKHMLQTRF